VADRRGRVHADPGHSRTAILSHNRAAEPGWPTASSSPVPNPPRTAASSTNRPPAARGHESRVIQDGGGQRLWRRD